MQIDTYFSKEVSLYMRSPSMQIYTVLSKSDYTLEELFSTIL